MRPKWPLGTITAEGMSFVTVWSWLWSIDFYVRVLRGWSLPRLSAGLVSLRGTCSRVCLSPWWVFLLPAHHTSFFLPPPAYLSSDPEMCPRRGAPERYFCSFPEVTELRHGAPGPPVPNLSFPRPYRHPLTSSRRRDHWSYVHTAGLGAPFRFICSDPFCLAVPIYSVNWSWSWTDQHAQNNDNYRDVKRSTLNLEWRKSLVNSGLTVHTEVALQNNLTCMRFRTAFVSGPNPNSSDLCCSTQLWKNNRSESHNEQKDLGLFCLRCEHSLSLALG